MNCTSPVRMVNPAYRAKVNLYDLTSREREEMLDYWQRLKANGVPFYVYYPCQKCEACRSSKAKEWYFRILTESERWNGCMSFVTLTYADEFLPVGKDGNPTLVKKEFQDFMKRFREEYRKFPKTFIRSEWSHRSAYDLGLRDIVTPQIKYFYCGEYGEKKGRPHYHVIIFGSDISTSEYLASKAWHFGGVDVGTVEVRSIRYVAGYVQKKLGVADNLKPDQEKPFRVNSKNFSLGYIEEHRDALSQRDYVTVNGRKFSMSRYFRDKLGISEDPLQISKEEWLERAKRTAHDLLQSKQRALNLKAKTDLRKLQKETGKF